jgi:serine O-acetyltransferase
MTNSPSEAQGPSANPTGNLSLDWQIDDVVQQLRDIRTDSLSFSARAKRPVKLPSARAITAFMDALSAAMFPNRLGNRQLADESVDYFVGYTLDQSPEN